MNIVLCLCAVFMTSANAGGRVRFRQNLSCKDKRPKAGDLWETAASSAGTCAIECYKDVDCNSFFVGKASKEKQSCYGFSSRIKPDESTLEEAKGWAFFNNPPEKDVEIKSQSVSPIFGPAQDSTTNSNTRPERATRAGNAINTAQEIVSSESSTNSAAIVKGVTQPEKDVEIDSQSVSPIFGPAQDSTTNSNTRPKSATRAGNAINTAQEIVSSEPPTSSAVIVEEAHVCPDGWFASRDSCYIISKDKRKWMAAVNQCFKMGGYLVEIDSEEETKFINRMIAATNEGDSLWTGATDRFEEGSWIWYHSGRVLGYQNWLDGEPNPIPIGDDCMRIDPKYGKKKWNDVPCYMRLHYICER